MTIIRKTVNHIARYSSQKLGKLSAVFLCLIFTIPATSQFLDLNMLNPMLTVEGSYYSPSGVTLDHEQRTERIGLQFPIKSKFSLGADWKELLMSKSIKDAISKIQPSAYQIMGNIDLYHSNYRNNWTTSPGSQDLAGGKVGLTGLHIWFKNRKPGSFIWNVNTSFMEDLDALDTYVPNISGTFGVGGLIKLKAIWFAGIYVNYYNRFFATPVLVLNGRISGHWKYSLIAPKEIKLVYKQSNRWKQDFVFGIDANQFQSPVFLGGESIETGFTNRVIYLKGSTQTRLKLGKKVHWYLEGGYLFDGRYNALNSITGSEAFEDLSGGWFARTKVTFSIGKSLINSGGLNLDL